MHKNDGYVPPRNHKFRIYQVILNFTKSTQDFVLALAHCDYGMSSA